MNESNGRVGCIRLDFNYLSIKPSDSLEEKESNKKQKSENECQKIFFDFVGNLPEELCYSSLNPFFSVRDLTRCNVVSRDYNFKTKIVNNLDNLIYSIAKEESINEKLIVKLISILVEAQQDEKLFNLFRSNSSQLAAQK